MSEAQVQWLGLSCGQHGSYTFYKGFALNVNGEIKKYRLGEFYYVRNSEDNPTCIAELQLIWYDSNSESQYASARLYFKPQDTPFEDLEGCGQDELLYAEQKILIHCEEMSKWECTGDKWNVGNVSLCEDDFHQINGKLALKPEVRYSKNHFCQPCLKARKFLILTYPAYCRYYAVRARLLAGAALTRPVILALGGIITKCRDTRIAFCRENFYHPEIEKFSFSNGIKAPVLKGRPRKKTVKGITLSKALKKKKMMQQFAKTVAKKKLHSESQISDTESIDTVQSDFSEYSVQSNSSSKMAEYEKMDLESNLSRSDDDSDDDSDDVKFDQTEQNNSILQEFCELKHTTKIDVVKVKEEMIENHKPLQTMQNNNFSESDMELLNIFKKDKKRKCIEEDWEVPIKKQNLEKIEKIETDHNENIPLKEQKANGDNTKYMEELKNPGNFNSSEERKFMDSLLTFMNKRKTPIGKIPALGFKKVNLYALFAMAQSLGGYEQVTEKRMWRRLYKELGGHTTITSAATTLRRHYERLLLPFEQHITGRTILTKDENKSVDSPVKKDIIVKPEISEQNYAVMKNVLLDKNDNLYSVPKAQERTAAVITQTKGQACKAEVVAKNRVQEQIPFMEKKTQERKPPVVVENKNVRLQDGSEKSSPNMQNSKIEVQFVLQPVHVPTIVRNSSVKQPPKLIEARKPPSPKAKEQLLGKKVNNYTPPIPKLVKITGGLEDVSHPSRSPWKQVIEITSDTDGSCDSDDSEQYVAVIQSNRQNGNIYHPNEPYIKQDKSRSPFGYQDVYYKQESKPIKKERIMGYERSDSPVIKTDRMSQPENARSPYYPDKRASRPNILQRGSPGRDNKQKDIEMTYLSFPVMDNHVIVDNMSLSGVDSYYSSYYSPYYAVDSPPSSNGSISPNRSKSRIFMPQPQFYHHNLPPISSTFMSQYEPQYEPQYETPSPNTIHPGHCLVGSQHSYQYVHGIPVASPNGSMY